MPEPITDKRGTVFDPARHLHKDGVPVITKDRGFFMPRGGRIKGQKNKPKAPEPLTNAEPGANGSSTPTTAPAAAPVTTPTPSPAPQPAPPPAASSTPTPEPNFDDLRALLDTTPPTEEPKKDGPPPVDHSDDLAEGFTRLLTILCGFLFGAPDEAKPDAEERGHLNKATAAYFRTKAWQFAAGAAFALAWVCYLLRLLEKPKSGERVRQWFGMEKAKDVTPAGGPHPARANNAPGAAAPIFNLPPTSKLGG